MVHKIRTRKMICCKLTATFNQNSSIRKVNRVHSLFFLDHKKRFVSYFQNVENVGATELIKMKRKSL